MPRTPRTQLTTLTFPSGNTFTLQTPPDPSAPTLLKFAAGSNADTGLHWHETHTEFFTIVQGIGKLTLENASRGLETFYVSKESGTVEIPRFRRHCLGRAFAGNIPSTSSSPSPSPTPSPEFPFLNVDISTVPSPSEWHRDLLVHEWTSPADGQKEIFFRNLAGVISEPRPAWCWGWVWGLWIELQIWVIGGELDNYPAVLGGRGGWMEWLFVKGLCLGARIVGGMVGLRSSYVEYTPVELREGRKGR